MLVLYGQDEDIDQCCMDRMMAVSWVVDKMGIMDRVGELVRIRGNGHVQYWDRMRVVIMEVAQNEDNDQGND